MLLLSPLALGVGAQADARCAAPGDVPAAVRPFVPPPACAVAVARADLDRDGRGDYVVVVGARVARAAAADTAPRALLVLLADPRGALRVAARGGRAVLCATCGGAMGDPFVGVEARAGGFTLRHYGGSSWRWSADYTFAHSRRDRAWQLVRVEEASFHASDPSAPRRRVSTPPRDFGKIDVRAFDAEAWQLRDEPRGA
jgi:hypothetical protein